MSKNRFLIVNADDFGQSHGVNKGIIKAFEDGIVTSASLMVRWDAVSEAVAYASEHPNLSVGIHLDFSEWIYRNDNWEPLYEVVSLSNEKEVIEEINRQFETFRELMGREPTHIDSHQHTHKEEPVRSIVMTIAKELNVPLRHYSPIRYCGDFYGQYDEGYAYHEGISVEAVIKIVKSLPVGVTELACHPAEGEDLETMYSKERAIELETLCNPEVRITLEREGVELCSFHNYPFTSSTANL